MRQLTAVYDLKAGPVSYDFVTWLVRARLEQQRRKADRLHVVILPYTDGLGGFARHWGPHDATAAYWRLWHIVMAACPLAGATVTLAPDREFRAEGETWMPEGKAHLLAPLVQAARAGEDIPLLRPTEQALRWARNWTAGGRTVTLTIRHNADDGRDSSPDWADFEHWLRTQRWTPLVLPDTADALDSAVGPFAALSLDLRAALYAGAAMNCFPHSGPMVLAWHSGAPMLAFNAGGPGEQWRRAWEKNLALRIGVQLPWATNKQRLVYRADTAAILREEFARLMGATR